MVGDNDIAALTDEIADILNKAAKHLNLTNYEVKANVKVQVGDGFVSNFYDGDVIDKDTGTTTKVAVKKSPTAFDFEYAPLFKNEVVFYESIVPALTQLQQEYNIESPFDNTAKYLGSSMEPKKEFIALEHMRPKGFTLHDKKQYFSREQYFKLFKIYGRFHGTNFVWKKQRPEEYEAIQSKLYPVFDIFVDKKSAPMFVQSLTAAANNLDSDSDVRKLSMDLAQNFEKTFSKFSNYEGRYSCATHGDCWSNNMMFLNSDSGELEDVKLIDFQLTRDSTPVHDLSYFFYASASKEDMDNLENYLKIYHESLSDTIKQFGEDPEEIFPFKVLLQEWKDNALMGIILGIYLWQIKLLNKEEYSDMLTDTSPESKEGAMQKFMELLQSVWKNERYIETSRNILQHAYEYGLLTADKIVTKTDS